MKLTYLAVILSFALAFSTSVRAVASTASHSNAHHFGTFHQTGGDPEPIDPPPPSGGGGGSK